VFGERGAGVYDGRRGWHEADDPRTDPGGKRGVPPRDDAQQQRVGDDRGGTDVVGGQSGQRARTSRRRSEAGHIGARVRRTIHHQDAYQVHEAMHTFTGTPIRSSFSFAAVLARTVVGLFITLARQSGTRCQMNLDIHTYIHFIST